VILLEFTINNTADVTTSLMLITSLSPMGMVWKKYVLMMQQGLD
jgi:hypothetical protein